MGKLIFRGLIVAILTVSTSIALGAQRSEVLNKPAPSFSLPDINSKVRSLTDWKGKLIILNFWATWCTPCRKEIPLLNQMQANYHFDGLQVIGVAVDNKQAVTEFNQTIPIDYVNLIGGLEAAKLTTRYGNNAGALPYTVIIDSQGAVTSIAAGLLTESYLRKVIERNL